MNAQCLTHRVHSCDCGPHVWVLSTGNGQVTSTPRHDGPTMEDSAAGELAGRTAPNNKTAGGARDQRA